MLVRLALCAVACGTVVRHQEGSESSLDAEWLAYLETPPAEALRLAERLAARADGLVEGLRAQPTLKGSLDVVVSGGGNLDAYYLGNAMLLSRLQAGGEFTMERFAGASAGGMMPFEFALRGEAAVVRTHLAYGALVAAHPSSFCGFLCDASLQDHLWRVMAAWQTKTYAVDLPNLDGKVFLATTCLRPLPTLVMISNFTAENDQATKAYMSTGTFFQWYDGMICSDGGSASGPDMTPLFRDYARQQLIVNLMHTDFPAHMVYSVNTTEYVALIERGQDEMAEFLRTGSVARDAKALTLCGKDQDTSKMVCA